MSDISKMVSHRFERIFEKMRHERNLSPYEQNAFVDALDMIERHDLMGAFTALAPLERDMVGRDILAERKGAAMSLSDIRERFDNVKRKLT